MKGEKTVDAYIEKHPQWREALTRLREIILSTSMEETIKWGAPVYTVNGKNVVGMGAFKSYVGLWFFQGALLKDEQKKLMNAQEGKTKALRQWRFQSPEEIEADAELIQSYIQEAINNQLQGKEIKADRSKPLIIPEELQEKLFSNSELAERFAALSKSCQREYAEYIAEAKRPETRLRRLEKIIPMIMEGAGLNDKYKK
ncbi:MAG: hypothetical protein D6748_07920 [Calditrichaeota bacterium]|nr:MAG: hypothetical protein D6748_07920 [Calditrichota bacterium]